jgi:hypothetical protein
MTAVINSLYFSTLIQKWKCENIGSKKIVCLTLGFHSLWACSLRTSVSFFPSLSAITCSRGLAAPNGFGYITEKENTSTLSTPNIEGLGAKLS